MIVFEYYRIVLAPSMEGLQPFAWNERVTQDWIAPSTFMSIDAISMNKSIMFAIHP